MSVTSVSGLIAALSMKPIPPMLVRNIAGACAAIAAASQVPDAAPAARTPADSGSGSGSGLDQRS